MRFRRRLTHVGSDRIHAVPAAQPHECGHYERRRGVVLLMVLLIVTVLTLAAYRYSELMAGEQTLASSTTRSIQAQALADSGIHYTAALLSNANTFAGVLGNAPWNNRQAFQGVIVVPNDRPYLRGRFSILSPPDPDESSSYGSTYRYGVSDESGKINPNAFMSIDPSGKVLHNMLMNLPNMTEDVADAIIDWIDVDNNPRPRGAEDDYYLALNPPYHCKNGPLDSLEELLLVRGVTPELLFGNDHNRNGSLDPGENTGNGYLDRGWSAYLTVYSREQNYDSQLNPRIYVNRSDVKKLYDSLLEAVGADLAYYIAAYRLYGPAPNPALQQAQAALSVQVDSLTPAGKLDSTDKTKQTAKSTDKTTSAANAAKKSTTTPSKQDTQPKIATRGQRDDLDFTRKPVRSINSLYELIGSSVNIPSKQGGGGGTHYESPLNDPATMRQLLPLLLDKTTTSGTFERAARININTAPLAVLAGLPGIPESAKQSMVEHRPLPWAAQAPDQIFRTPAWLITEANFNPLVMAQLDKYITTRSQTYRVQVVGYFDRGGPNARVEAVIDTNGGRPRIVYRRDLMDLGLGFNLEK